MGLMVRYIEQDKKTGRLIYRRVFPARLRPYVPGNLAQLKRSLRGRSEHDSGVMALYAQFQAEYEHLAAMAEKQAEGRYDRLDAATVDYLAEAFRAEALADDDAARWDTEERQLYAAMSGQEGVIGQFDDAPSLRWASKRRETLEASVAHSRALLGAGDLEGIVGLWGWETDQFAFAKGLRLDTTSPQFMALCQRICVASLEAAEVSLARLDGKQIDTPAPPESPSEGSFMPPSARSSEETLQELGERLIGQKVDPISRTTAQGWRTALRFWREVHGSIGWQAISRRHVTAWLELMAQRPARIGRTVDTVPLPELVVLYSDREDVPRLTGKTVRQHLGSLSSLWGKAQRRGWIERDENPFANHDVHVETKVGGNPLTPQELKAVFSLPIYCGGERPRRGREEAAFWIPLFSLCTGARPGEIAQLLVSDFWLDDDGRWIMQYTDAGEHPAAGPRSLKTSRHRIGERRFPVPQPMLELGLPSYLDWLKGQGEQALFPKLTLTTKGLYDGWGRWWGEYVRQHGAIGKGKRQLRELRHNFPTAARHRTNGVSEEALAYILGHSTNGARTTARYGDRSQRGEEITMITDFGVDVLKIVKPWEPPR